MVSESATIRHDHAETLFHFGETLIGTKWLRSLRLRPRKTNQHPRYAISPTKLYEAPTGTSLHGTWQLLELCRRAAREG